MARRPDQSTRHKRRGLVARMSGLLDWPEVDLVLANALGTAPFPAFLAIIGHLVLARPQRAPFLNPAFLPTAIAFAWALVAWWVLVALTAWRLRGRGGRTRWLTHVMFHTWFAGYAVITYFLGTFTTPTWVIFVGFAAMGFVFIEVRAVMAGLATAGVVLAATTVAAQLELIPYAPLLKEAPFAGGRISILWVIAACVTGFGSCVNVLVVLAAATTRSREKEAALEGAFANLQEAHLERAQLVKALETMQHGVFVTGPGGVIMYVNPAAAQMHGYSEKELIGANVSLLLAPDDAERRESIRTGKREALHRRRNGATFEVQLTSDLVRNDKGRPVGAVTVCEDISERRRIERALRESEERYALMAAATSDGVWDWDLKAGFIYFSPRWKEIVGYGPDELGNTLEDWLELVHPDDREQVKSDLWYAIEGDTPYVQCEYRMLHKEGALRWVITRGQIARDEQGKAYRVTGAQSDMSERAFYDQVTQLPNRSLFLERVSRALQRARYEDGYRFAVLVLDLDNFTQINEGFGRAVGDRLLSKVADALKNKLGRHQVIARIGGSKFAVLLEGVSGAPEVRGIANELRGLFERSFDVGAQEIVTTASIGIVDDSHEYTLPEDLLRDAELAVHDAKARGRAGMKTFDPMLRTHVLRHAELEKGLRYAIERGELVPYFQPIMAVANQQVAGFEALVRWHHPEQGVVPPLEFIGVAEETGLIVPLGFEVLKASCRQMVKWRKRYVLVPSLTLSVNLSGRQFLHGDLVARIQEILADTGFPAVALKFEVTESVLMEDAYKAKTILDRLKVLGVSLCIDDFGTGYSSLAYLTQFPVDVLKVDRSFVSNMDRQKDKREIVRATITLAQSLGMEVIAEGVERHEELSLLKQMGCTWAQGYYYGKPLPERDATAFLESKTAKAVG